MYSLRSIVALSLLICCWNLLIDIRPSFAMPIEGDKKAVNYQDMYKLITQRLQNLTQLNQESDQNIRRSFVRNITVNNRVMDKSPSQNTPNMNLTTVLSPILNLTQVNQTAVENNRRSYVPLTTSYPRSPLTGNLAMGNQLADNTVSGNTQRTNSSTGNSTVGNPQAGNSVTTTRPAGNSAGNILVGNKAPVRYRVGNLVAGNSPVYKSHDGSLPGATPWARNSPAANPTGVNELIGNSLVENKPVAKVITGALHGSSYLTNAEHTSASVFSNSYNAGPIVPGDRSDIYTNLYRYPSKYVKKDTIYRQTSTLYGQPTLYNHNPSKSTGGIQNYEYPGNYPWSQYSSYTGYPGYVRHHPNLKEKQTRRGYLAQRPGYPGYPGSVSHPNLKERQTRRGYLARRPGYDVDYPRILGEKKQGNYSGTKQTHNKDPVGNDVQNNTISNKTDQYSTTEVSSNLNTIQEKFPGNPGGLSTPSLSQPPSLENIDAENFGSSSGSGFDEPVEMGNEADFEQPQGLISSGSGDESEDLDTTPVSDVAFMLAGTKHKPSPLSVAGLPRKLTRKQALEIYKSAMYFAGLMKEDNNVESTSEQSGNDDIDDEGKRDHSFTDEEDNDVTITDNDVKEALAASSRELYSSGQEASGVEASGSQLEALVKVVPSTENKTSTGENEAAEKEAPKANNVVQENDKGASKNESVAPKSNNEAPPKQASEPQTVENKPQPKESSSVDEIVETDTQPQETSNSNDASQASQPETSVLNEQTQAVDVPAKEVDNTETPPPLDTRAGGVSSYKQTSDSAQLDLNAPSSDEALMKETQANYAADQQGEQALSNLLKSRQRGAYSSPTQRAVICKDTIQKISCPPNQKIRILNADYGDTGNVGCLKESNPMPSGPCRTPGAYETVKRDCEGFDECELSASNDIFGDACPDSNKYLDVNYDCVNNAARKKYEPPTQDVQTSSPGLRPLVQPPQFAFQVPYQPPAPAYGQASYQPAPQYVNPVPSGPVAYAPAPYQAPPASAYAPAMGLPDMLPPSPYVAPDPCNPCNTCAQCSLQVCNPCAQTCQTLSCPPRIPARLQPLWEQWNERTADMSRMEMAALIISPLPKLSPTKAPEATESSGASEGSESGEPTLDEDALYEASKKSEIQRIKPQKKSKKTTLTAHKKNDSDQEFLRNSDLMVSSGDASSGSST